MIRADLKVWSQTSSTIIIWEIVRNKNSPPFPRLTKSDILGIEPSSLCLNKPSRWLWCMPKFQNLCISENRTLIALASLILSGIVLVDIRPSRSLDSVLFIPKMPFIKSLEKVIRTLARRHVLLAKAWVSESDLSCYFSWPLFPLCSPSCLTSLSLISNMDKRKPMPEDILRVKWNQVCLLSSPVPDA